MLSENISLKFEQKDCHYLNVWEDEQEEAARVMLLVAFFSFCGGEFMSIYDCNF